MTYFFGIILVGLIIGTATKTILMDNISCGFLTTIALGIAGSCSAMLLGEARHLYAPGQVEGFVTSVAAAIAAQAACPLLNHLRRARK